MNWIATDAVREKSRTLSMKNYPLLNIAVHLVRTSPLRGYCQQRYEDFPLLCLANYHTHGRRHDQFMQPSLPNIPYFINYTVPS